MNIGFIGLGKLGKPCAEIIANKGHNVAGYDIVEQTSNFISVEKTIQDVVKQKDIVFIAVPTPHDPAYDGKTPTSHLQPKDFDYTTVKQVVEEANKYMNKTQLLVLISTVLPGTVRREIAPLVSNTRFVYNPYLIAMGTVAWDMVNPEMIMIGTEDGSETGDAKHLINFYKTIMENNPRYVIGTWDECECIKVFYNTFISAKIGLVNMIQDVAQRQGNINVDVITTALAQSTQRITGPAYMKAGMGDGGSCHPRDNIALRHLSKNLNLGYDLFGTIMDAREKQAENMAIEIVKHGKKVQFSSDSYKSGVSYIDGSYSLLVQHYVKKHGGDIVNYSPDVFVIVHSGDPVPANVLVFDPWRTYTGPNKTVSYGNTRWTA
jgi:UDPglucose 6-dehydrogenase